VFEVDRPATQAAKRELLEAAGLDVPGSVSFVAADFETGRLREQPVQSGLDPFRPVFVSWLGVTMHLTRQAILATLTDLGGFAPGSEIVADHLLPAELRDAAGNGYAEAVAPMAAEEGEPWPTFLSPPPWRRSCATPDLKWSNRPVSKTPPARPGGTATTS